MKKAFPIFLILLMLSSCNQEEKTLQDSIDTTAKNISATVETASSAFGKTKNDVENTVNTTKKTISTVQS